MKLVSVAGIGCYVKNPAQTAAFYEALGFQLDKRDTDYVRVRLNWFWIEFVAQDKEAKPEFRREALLENKGAGQFLNIKVDDVDGFYRGLLARGLKPSSEPRDWPWGKREFVIRDPDGYKLVFFQQMN